MKRRVNGFRRESLRVRDGFSSRAISRRNGLPLICHVSFPYWLSHKPRLDTPLEQMEDEENAKRL